MTKASPVGLDHQERLGDVLGIHHGDAERTGSVGLVELRDVGRARDRDDGLALEVVDLIELQRLLGHEAACREEMRVGEGHLLLTIGVVGRRAAFEIDGAVRHQRNAAGRGDDALIDLELVQLELGLDLIDDLHADVDCVADDLLLVVDVAEGHGTVAIPSVIAPVSLIFFSVPLNSCA